MHGQVGSIRKARRNAQYFARSMFCLRWFSTIALVLGCLLSDPVAAQEAGETSPAEDTEATEQETIRPTLELGQFNIKDLRPIRNETAKLTFTLYLAFSESLDEQQVDQLEHWKHRLRDQVITAVRVTQMKDFQEPDLSSLRRNILIRVNRLLKSKSVEEVFLTEYLFRTH